MIKNEINFKTIAIHTLIWLCYGFLVFSLNSNIYEVQSAILLSLHQVIKHCILFYVNVLILLPYFINRNKYAGYVLSTILVITALYFTFDLIDITRIPKSDVFPKFQGPPPGSHRSELIPRRYYFQIVSSFAVLFISTIYWVTTEAQKRKQREEALKTENLDTELRFLKSQINPHFLFNALNNLYSLSYTQSKQAPEMILKLSEMMRYMLDERNASKVALAQEINYIKNYVDFQKLKMESKGNLELDIQVENEQLRIEPMLFIPFIENSFKHGQLENNKGSWIKITLRTEGQKIFFSTSNSLPKSAIAKDATSGIGLPNVKKRLEYLYPQRHELEISEDSNAFSVNLTLEIQ